MQKLSIFWRTVVLTFTSLPYYADVLKAKFGFSFQYFLFFNLVVAVLTTLRILVPFSFFNIPHFADQVVSAYPADLVVNVAHGKVAINQPLPYAVPLPAGWTSPDLSPQEEVKNLVVFDQDGTVSSIDDFTKYSAYAVVTPSQVYTLGGDTEGALKVTPVSSQIQSWRLDKSMVTQVENQFLHHPVMYYKLYLPIGAVILFLIFFPLFILLHLWTVFLYSLIVFVIALLLQRQILHGQKLSLTKVIQLGFHTITILITIGYLADVLGILHFWYGVLFFLAYVGLNLMALHAATAEASTPSSPTVALTPNTKEVTPAVMSKSSTTGKKPSMTKSSSQRKTAKKQRTSRKSTE